MGICKSKISYLYDKHLIYRINHSNGYLQIYIRGKKLNINIYLYLLYNCSFSINKVFANYKLIIFNIGKIEYVNNEKLIVFRPHIAENKLYYDNNLVFVKTLEYIEYYYIN